MEYITSLCYNQINCEDGLKKNIYPDTLIPPLPELTTRNPVTAELTLYKNTSIWTTVNKFSTSATLNSFIKHILREKGSGKDQTQVTLNI